ncbi:DUF2283 domain-containing protein [Oscillatoria laete-virens NRMC-F 0139]|nr:DUF2283 domain-containing protein [Oscillatoria laete-virens]MDL5052342.1 DUF2283 domain-containing protein [Oscillatoria laete-virens NRMC-F 0139]
MINKCYVQDKLKVCLQRMLVDNKALFDHKGTDTREIEEGIILDIDEHGRAVGLDIDQASKHLNLTTLNLKRLPFKVEQTA